MTLVAQIDQPHRRGVRSGTMHYLIRFIGLLLLLGWGAASAQSRLPACPATGPFHNCVATFKLQNDMYVGEVKDGKLSGKVAITFANGDKYVGEVKNNAANGQGTATFANGKYVGEFKDGDVQTASGN